MVLTPDQLAHFDTSDPGIGLFHACLQAGAPMTFAPGMRVLEVGCQESDWLVRAPQAFPDVEFVGLDWRIPSGSGGRVTTIKGNGLDGDLFPPLSFDAIVSLSAIEHFGLGHYSADPLHPDGDTKIVANCWRWLKPGGWFYFDVPYDPTGYRVAGTEYRVYDEAAMDERLWLLAKDRRYFAHATDARTLIPKPTEPTTPFYYCAMVCQKHIPAWNGDRYLQYEADLRRPARELGATHTHAPQN